LNLIFVTQQLNGKFRVHQVINIPKGIGESFINYIASHAIPDDRADILQTKLDDMRQKLGNTNENSMTSTDKRYKPFVDFSYTKKEVIADEVKIEN
jgi:hypothetical protein